MKTSLVTLLKMNPAKVTTHRLRRLFRLLSFYKNEELQPSDFDRLITDVNPFLTATLGPVKTAFKESMGGGFINQSTRDWKYSAIQQMGVALSRLYPSLQAGFNQIGNNKDKVNFEDFKSFIEKHDVLAGFDITVQLLRQLFAELDPHKKTYLSFKDWQSAFKAFDYYELLGVELKNYLQC